MERAFRDPDSPVRILAATTTVAAGVNTPASTVILAEQEFLGEDGRPFTVAEYKNMAGRAGRLGFNEKGTSIILADAEHPRTMLFNRYVTARPEALRSSFADSDISTWLLRLLTQVESIERAQVGGMLSRTYAGFCFTRQDPSWAQRMQARVEDLLGRMSTLQLLEEDNGRIRLSLLGQACGRSALSFDSAMQLVQLLRAAGRGLQAEQLVALIQGLPEADDLGAPLLRGRRGEVEWIQEAAIVYGDAIVQGMQTGARDMRTYHGRCKRACVLHEWLKGTPVRTIEDRFSKGPFASMTFGSIRSYADGTRFWLGSAVEILQLVLLGSGPSPASLDALLRRLELGIPEAGLPLMEARLELARGECLALLNAGLNTPELIWQAAHEQLKAILSPSRATALLALRPRSPVEKAAP